MNELRRHNGVALIEVLVAFVVFSVGVLGTFSMQVVAKRINNDAAQQSIATALASDILARMRVNSKVLDAYVVDDIGGEEIPVVDDCSKAICSNLQIAERDIYEWSELLNGEQERVVVAGRDTARGGLLDARGCIENDDGIVSIRISWKSANGSIGASETSCGERILAGIPSEETLSALTMTSYMVQP